MGSTEIKDYSTYNHRMELSMVDKLFFVDKIQPDFFVDFGCADGTLLKSIKAMNPTIPCMGYDIDRIMCKHSTDDIHIVNDWDVVRAEMKKYSKPALILNSVIHEVCHYGSQVDIC